MVVKGVYILFSIFLLMTLQVNSQYTDLKRAFDAGFVRAVVSGDYSRLSSVDPTNIYVQDCIPTISYYPFPASPTGFLAKVLSTKTFQVAAFQGSSPPSFDTSTNPPNGWSVDFINIIVKNIGDNYNVNLHTNWTIYETSQECFDALALGKVHAILPNFVTGGFYNGTRRLEHFIPTCALAASDTSIYVRASSNWNLSIIKSASGLKVITAGTGSAAEAVAFFPSSFTVYDVLTDTSVNPADVTRYIFDAVRSGAYDISWDNYPYGNDTADGLRYINSGLIYPAVGFLNNELLNVPTPHPTPSPSCGGRESGQNVININFAHILAR